MKYECSNCKRIFKYKKDLDIHVKKKTCKDKLYICPECNLRYKLRSSLKRHIKSKHLDKIKSIDIPSCTSTQMLSNNINKKSAEPMNCLYCDKKYANRYVLKNHVTHYCPKNPNITKKTKKKSTKKNNGSETASGSTTNNSHNTTTNNNTTNNTINTNHSHNTTNSHNTITNNIIVQLNNFGDESLKNITDEEFLKAIINPSDIPGKYLELKYIKKKENRTVYRNTKENKLYVRKNNKWNVEPVEDDIYHQMKIRAIDDIDAFIKRDGLVLFNRDEIHKKLNRIERATYVMGNIKFMLDNNESTLHENFEDNPSK